MIVDSKGGNAGGSMFRIQRVSGPQEAASVKTNRSLQEGTSIDVERFVMQQQ